MDPFFILACVMISRNLLLFLLFVAGSMLPVQLEAVGGKEVKQVQREDNREIDGLSLAAYISVVAGIASLFILPGASLLLMPVGLILGLVAIFGRRNRYERRRGRGLALAAIVLGGAYALAMVLSLAVFVFFGF